MTSAERIARFRQRKAEAGQAEVRGIYAPPELHAAIKRAAELLKGEEPKEPD
jgi:glutamate/tyrosine decarboxylase-like PLP-dependent enzyme